MQNTDIKITGFNREAVQKVANKLIEIGTKRFNEYQSRVAELGDITDQDRAGVFLFMSEKYYELASLGATQIRVGTNLLDISGNQKDEERFQTLMTRYLLDTLSTSSHDTHASTSPMVNLHVTQEVRVRSSVFDMLGQSVFDMDFIDRED